VRWLLRVGGRQGKLPIAAFEVYEFETSRWRKLPDIPSKRVFALYAHSDTHIFSVGGLHQDPRHGFSDVTEVFDLDTGIIARDEQRTCVKTQVRCSSLLFLLSFVA